MPNTAVASSKVVLPLLLMLLLTVQVDAECCVMNPPLGSDHPGAVLQPSPALITNLLYGGDSCNDGTRGTPCCGVGSCNIFCCNCDGGCRKPPIDWYPDFQNGASNVRWQFDCDFPGYDISNHDVKGEDCGELCIKTAGCNAFSHHHGICYLKNVEVLNKQPAEGGICGFLPWGLRYISGDSRK
uniref:Apple domain-containing protein n=1 Tax=Daphnia galeata TaxID=27404 RepID=A0A8J2S7D7_9CRUS|nr:unnamed protein product [Daphnia galeata]